ncbi:MAG: DMT family transporter [Candidatus Adiutrix sp.]
MPPEKQNPGFKLAFGSALAYTFFDIGVRAFIHEMTVWGLLFIRGALGVLLIGVLAAMFKRPLWGDNKFLLFVGLCLYASSVCNTITITTIPLYQALVLIYLYPVFSLILAAPINGEPITRHNLFLSLLAVLGCLALLWPDEAIGLTFGQGHLIGISGAFLYSLGQVSIRRMGAANSGLEPIFFYSLYAFVFSWPLAMAFGSELGLGNPKGLSIAFCLAAIGVTAHLTGFAALRWIPGFKVGIIGTLELFLGLLASWLIFSDPLSLRAIVGGLIIVVVTFQLKSPSR